MPYHDITGDDDEHGGAGKDTPLAPAHPAPGITRGKQRQTQNEQIQPEQDIAFGTGRHLNREVESAYPIDLHSNEKSVDFGKPIYYSISNSKRVVKTIVGCLITRLIVCANYLHRLQYRRFPASQFKFERMILPPTIPIIFLFLGALAIGAGDLARLRHPTAIMVISSALALVAVLTLQSALPVTQVVAAWQPVSVFTVPISFRVDQTAWILAVGLMLVLNATALTWIGFPGRHWSAPRALSLLLAAAALAGVFASNLLTLALAWGVLDIVFVSALLVRSGAGVGRRAALAIVLNAASTL